MMAAPRLETERLVLDAHNAADFEALAAMWADETVVRFIGGKALSRHEAWVRLLQYGGLWPLMGFGTWAVREKAGGRFMGQVGFADFHRELEQSIDGLPEAGWVLASWAHGQGFGSEALRAALQWLDAQGHARSVCLIDPGNAASRALARRHGYGAAEMVNFKGNDTLLLTRAKP